MTTGAFSTNILGFQPRMTTEASNVSHFFHPMYYTVAVQESAAPAAFDLGLEGKRATRVNLDILCGIQQLDGLRVVTIS